MAYGQVMACLLKLTLRNMFINLGKSCGKNACIYLFIFIIIIVFFFLHEGHVSPYLSM